MNKDQESLQQLIDAIEDLPRLPTTNWRNKHPEIFQISMMTHPLELPCPPLRTNVFHERLQLELQLRMAKCLTRSAATRPDFAAL